MPLQSRNQLIWQSLEEGAGKRCSECVTSRVELGQASNSKHWFTTSFLQLKLNFGGRCRKAVLGVCLLKCGARTSRWLLVDVWDLRTLRASLSGTFLQTLPDLVTPLKGHSLSPRSCPATRSAPSERFGYMTVEAT